MSLEIIEIKDPESGSSAKIAPTFGFNCFEFLANVDGQAIDVLWAADDFADGTARPSSSGIPLLFPFPGRIHGTKLSWEDRQFEIPEGDGRGNAIHGFVMNRAWRVTEQTESHVTAEFQASRDDATLMEQWPTDFKVTATYEVSGTALTGTYRIENPSAKPLPFGFGTHPYFKVPIGGESADACEIIVPYTFAWEFKDQMASGNQFNRDTDPFQPILFQDTQFDNGFGGLESEDGLCTTSIHDPGSGRTIEQQFDDQFDSVVLYNPGHREAFCIEPYTCIPDAFQLRRQGYDGGLRVLPAGETFETSIRIRVK
ncbi:aldose 1-epimerase [Blastopirellula marina]|uniref:Aldose 1-epimerase n=1 Tax=Blastopirellula marina TaxID=124 RepID=A0A2S8GDT8_9BACT|nr:aldose 1-epimerase [Blastopirellula marina]PQO42254.1 aldose 1-epimerase [Blastopirellula marina]